MDYEIPAPAGHEEKEDGERAAAIARIRALNDELRTTGLRGKTFLSRGVLAKGSDFVAKACAAVKAFDTFTENNDPWGEHDCATLDVDGERVMFKIDCFDLDMKECSPDPADPKVTQRVLTIMLAEDY